jgi:hypothetical protein
MANPDTIWLAPECEEESLEGRSWCQDNVWDEDCDFCGEKPVKYVRADLVENSQSCIKRLEELNQSIRKLQDWKESASKLLTDITNARDAGMTDEDKQRYLGNRTEDVITDLWRRVRYAEAANENLQSIAQKVD